MNRAAKLAARSDRKLPRLLEVASKLYETLKARAKATIIWAVTHRLIPRWAASALIQVLKLRDS